jgi:hypothetical protein
MKQHTLLFAACLLSATASFAQKGSVLLAGDIGYSGNKVTPPDNPSQAGTSSSFYLAPQIGYQFSRNWTVGAIASYTHYGNKNNDASSGTGVDFYSAGPFVRYTHSLNSWLSVYGEFQATWSDYGKQNVDPSNPTVPQQTTAYEFSVFPALLFKLGKGFGINLSLGGLDYGLTHVHKFGTTGQSFNLNFGETALIGLSKNFGGHS